MTAIARVDSTNTLERSNANVRRGPAEVSPAAARDEIVASGGRTQSPDLRDAAHAAGPNVGPNVASNVPYADLINASAHKYGIPPTLLAGLIKQESGFDPNIVSSAGAVGLTQLEPGTARELGVTNAYDPAQNIDGGAKYLSQQLHAFNGNVSLALAAYNAGPGAVQKYGGIPPYPETQAYVRNVEANAAHFAGGAEPGTVPVPGGSASPTSGRTSGAAGAGPDQRYGSRGAGVQGLQHQLGITADGDFGPKTRAAVEAFQRAHGLQADGVVGPQTRAALAASMPQLSYGSHGNDVAALQQKLGVTADGDFGPKTQAAVERYQRTHGLQVDGVAGPKTWASLEGVTGPVSKGAAPGNHPGGGGVAPAGAGGAPGVPADGNAVQVANSQIGVHAATGDRNEDPGGANGPIHAYQSETGAYDAAWCASFVSWVMDKSHAPTDFRSAAVGNWVDAARNGEHNLHTVAQDQIKPGDLVAFSWDNGSYHDGNEHIGIVTSVGPNGTFNYTSGNTDNAGQSGVVANHAATLTAPGRVGSAGVTFIRVGS